MRQLEGGVNEKYRRGAICGLVIVKFFFICSIATKMKRRKISMVGQGISPHQLSSRPPRRGQRRD